MNNIIYLNRDNPVAIKFSFDGDFESIGLTGFDSITIEIGGETYSNVLNEREVVFDVETLRIRIGLLTSLSEGTYTIKIVGFSPTYPNGYVLNKGTEYIGPVYVRNP